MAWQPSPRVDCEAPLDLSGVAGKTAVVTGGASGIGEAYVRALYTAGVIVVVGDRDVQKGRNLESELKGVKFVPCDVANWQDQVELFKKAASFSPSRKIHYVIANAGISAEDDIFKVEGGDDEYREPDLGMIHVNLYGALYSAKLALRYFVLQNGIQPNPNQEDTCLIFISSGAGFLDVPRTPLYCSTKWAVRGIMHSLRRTAFYSGTRVNIISPWYVQTSILPQEAFDKLRTLGVELATSEDAGRCALRILGNKSINGKNLFLCPRKWASSGCMDLDLEDYRESGLLQEIQAEQVMLTPVELGLFP